MVAFRKAQKVDSKLRMSISGPSGSGKTWTSLVLATALADGKPIAVIDTERGSASKYASDFGFDVMELDTFHPDKFIAGIREAQEAGYAVLVIDSLSHAWNGTGGLLEIVEAITKRSSSKNSFTAWSEATPIQNRLIDAITRSNMHIICTMRSKQEYALETVNGKTVPKKVGMAPIQRADLEYEFDVAADMDHENTMIVQKSRCSALSGAVISKPDAKVAETLKAWLHSDIPAPQKPQLHVVQPQEGQEPASPALDVPTPGQLRERFKALGLKGTFEQFVKFKLNQDVSDEQLTPTSCQVLSRRLAEYEEKATTGAVGGQ